MWIRGLDLMGRTKKRHRAWRQQMRARARKRRGYGYRWDDDISPGRLVAWAEPERNAEAQQIREQEKEDAFSRQISIASQALFCFAIILLLLNVVNQVVKICF